MLQKCTLRLVYWVASKCSPAESYVLLVVLLGFSWGSTKIRVDCGYCGWNWLYFQMLKLFDARFAEDSLPAPVLCCARGSFSLLSELERYGIKLGQLALSLDARTLEGNFSTQPSGCLFGSTAAFSNVATGGACFILSYLFFMISQI